MAAVKAVPSVRVRGSVCCRPWRRRCPGRWRTAQAPAPEAWSNFQPAWPRQQPSRNPIFTTLPFLTCAKPTVTRSGKTPENALAERAMPRLAIGLWGRWRHTALHGGGAGPFVPVLRALRTIGEEDQWFKLMGLSGTSGGAITAAMAWSEVPDDSWAEGARRVLRYWNRNKASLETAGKQPICGAVLHQRYHPVGMSLRHWLPEVNFPPSGWRPPRIRGACGTICVPWSGCPSGRPFLRAQGVDLFIGAVDIVNPGAAPDGVSHLPRPAGLRLRPGRVAGQCPHPRTLHGHARELAGRRRLRRDPGGVLGRSVLQNPPINDFLTDAAAIASPICCGWCRSTQPLRRADAGPRTRKSRPTGANEPGWQSSPGAGNCAPSTGST